ncbi:hypothetical protein MTR67_004220 [Solanum verrucosum]|uniref:Pectinesterase catalytic domain-containing protein n=1 Tax=Solanum verrucosum TaxID=315347 RepID=A0AAF0PVT7_SOLVR|nr:hypothetical protein MTR67_004220 [Solanum verrucosum]
MLVGDGMDATIITGNLNVVDGATTFNCFCCWGWIHSSRSTISKHSRATKHQAVALRVGEDQSVINGCKIDAFQDTLYTHTLHQFYRDCYITGTVDVIISVCKLDPHGW